MLKCSFVFEWEEFTGQILIVASLVDDCIDYIQEHFIARADNF
ncbi:hypothetical protein B4113_3350 [Geobacillus sp. B4113_201601]|nr:hypothetical protein B4113_3350 [Geobacillus sp. B4113_201601]